MPCSSSMTGSLGWLRANQAGGTHTYAWRGRVVQVGPRDGDRERGSVAGKLAGLGHLVPHLGELRHRRGSGWRSCRAGGRRSGSTRTSGSPRCPPTPRPGRGDDAADAAGPMGPAPPGGPGRPVGMSRPATGTRTGARRAGCLHEGSPPNSRTAKTMPTGMPRRTHAAHPGGELPRSADLPP